MMRFPTQEADDLRRSEASHAFSFAFAFAVLTVFLTIAAALFGWALALPFAGYITMLVFITGGLAVGVILVTGLRRGRGVVTRVVRVAERWLDMEIKLKTATLPAPIYPALPALTSEPDITVTSGSRAVVLRPLVNGFDPADLEWFAAYLANGNPWTETRLEDMPLPSGGKIGKDGEGSPYRKLLTLCIERGIIVNRGGAGNKSGTLAIKEEREIVRLLKKTNAA